MPQTWLCCYVTLGLITASVGVSTFSFLAVSLDQFCAVVHPFRYLQLVNKNNAVVCIVVIWVGAIFFGMLPALGWRRRSPTKCSVFEILDAPYSVLLVCLLYYVTGAIIIGLYVRVFTVARRHLLAIAAQVCE